MRETQERLRKIAEKAHLLRGLIAIYEVEEGGERGPQLPAPIGDQTQVTDAYAATVTGGNAADSTTKKDRMEQSITVLLSERGSVHRKEILAHLIAQNIMGSEKNQMGQLAAWLSENRSKFASDGRGNFSLRRLTIDDATARLRPRPNGSSQEEAGGVAPPAGSVA